MYRYKIVVSTVVVGFQVQRKACQNERHAHGSPYKSTIIKWVHCAVVKSTVSKEGNRIDATIPLSPKQRIQKYCSNNRDYLHSYEMYFPRYGVPGTWYQYSCLLRLLLPNVYVHIRIAFQQNHIYTVYICPVCPINHFENDPGIM